MFEITKYVIISVILHLLFLFIFIVSYQNTNQPKNEFKANVYFEPVYKEKIEKSHEVELTSPQRKTKTNKLVTGKELDLATDTGNILKNSKVLDNLLNSPENLKISDSKSVKQSDLFSNNILSSTTSIQLSEDDQIPVNYKLSLKPLSPEEDIRGIDNSEQVTTENNPVLLKNDNKKFLNTFKLSKNKNKIIKIAPKLKRKIKAKKQEFNQISNFPNISPNKQTAPLTKKTTKKQNNNKETAEIQNTLIDNNNSIAKSNLEKIDTKIPGLKRKKLSTEHILHKKKELNDYKLTLRKLVMANRRYPDTDLKKFLILVEVEIDRLGNLLTLKIKQKSGRAVLDAAAERAIRLSLPFPEYPESFDPNQKSFKVIFRFDPEQ